MTGRGYTIIPSIPVAAKMIIPINRIDLLKRSGATPCQRIFGITYSGVHDECARTDRSEPRRGECLT